MLTALGSLATQQANPTQNTMKKVKQLLDYAETHPDAIVTYNASNMVLAVHSNASYVYSSFFTNRRYRKDQGVKYNKDSSSVIANPKVCDRSKKKESV
jgi:hypothetical protein